MIQRQRRAGALLAGALLSVTMLAGACSHSSSGAHVASVAPTSGGATSSMSATAKPSALAYSQCMRSHGISDFPDPNSQGQLAINAEPGTDLDPNNQAYKAAQSACSSLDPGAGTSTQQQQDYTSRLKYAHCMQGRGIPIPDPQAPGSGPGVNGNSTGASQGTNGIDPNSSSFIAANKACAHFLPAGSGPGVNTGGGS